MKVREVRGADEAPLSEGEGMRVQEVSGERDGGK